MPIAKRPTASAVLDQPVDEKQIEAFISGASAEVLPAPIPVDTKKKPTPVRFDPEMYPLIDKAAKRRGLSRAAWVRLVVSQALEHEGNR
jgi:hypothetical protein